MILSIRTRNHLDREAFGWNGPVDREAFGRNGLPGGKVFGPTSPADREVQGGTVQRVGRSSGQTFLRIATPGSIGSLDQYVFGRIGPLKRKAAKSNGPRRGVRSALRSTLHGPRVRALDASFFWPRDGRRRRARRGQPAPTVCRVASSSQTKGPAWRLREAKPHRAPAFGVRCYSTGPASMHGRSITGDSEHRQLNFVVQDQIPSIYRRCDPHDPALPMASIRSWDNASKACDQPPSSA